jgi:hypothetical protein
LRRPGAADQPARRWLSESEASLVLGIIHALCRDFLRCLITTDRPGWAIANLSRSTISLDTDLRYKEMR